MHKLSFLWQPLAGILPLAGTGNPSHFYHLTRASSNYLAVTGFSSVPCILCVPLCFSQLITKSNGVHANVLLTEFIGSAEYSALFTDGRTSFLDLLLIFKSCLPPLNRIIGVSPEFIEETHTASSLSLFSSLPSSPSLLPFLPTPLLCITEMLPKLQPRYYSAARYLRFNLWLSV